MAIARHDGPRVRWNAVRAAVEHIARQIEPPRPRLIFKVPPPAWFGSCPAFRHLRTEDDANKKTRL